ncbi:MAG: Methionyl-tRNA synthetase, partial [uncultured Blastococcus sp.]
DRSAHPDRSRLALRERAAAHRPRLGLRRPLRRVQPLPPHGRGPGAHGQRDRRARHADHGRRRRRGRLAPGDRRPEQPDHRGRPAGAGAELRPLHPDDDGQPRRGQPGDLPGPAQERVRLPPDDPRRHQPVHRPHAARPLHRGHLPDLRVPQRPRRPVRQLRQPAGPHRPDQPGQQDQRRDAEVRRERALLPRPAGLHPCAGRLAGHPPELAAQRPQLQRQPAGRPQAAQLHPRHRLGRPGAAGRLAGPLRQAHLRLVRRRRRLPLGVDRVGPPVGRPGGMAPVVADAGRGRLLLHGQGQHRLPLRDLARPAARLQRRGGQGRHAGSLRPAQPADRGRLQRVPHHGGAEVLQQPPGRHLRARLPRPLRRRRAALLHRRRRPGEPGHRLHLDGVPAPQQRRAGRRLGQPGQPVGVDGGEERRRGPHAGRPHRRRPRPAGHHLGRLRPDRRPALAQPAEGRDRRGDAGGLRGEQVPVGPGAVEAQGGPGPPRHGPAHRPAGDQGLQRAADALPPALRAAGARAARRDRRLVGRAGDPRGHRPRRRLAVPDHHGPVRPGPGGLGVDAPGPARHAAGAAEADLHQARRVGRRGGDAPARGRRV